MITEEKARQNIRELLEYIGEDPDRTGLIETPDRMLRMFKEMFRGYDPAQKPVITTFPNGQDGIIYDDMVVDSGCFYSVCEHHCRTTAAPSSANIASPISPTPRGASSASRR